MKRKSNPPKSAQGGAVLLNRYLKGEITVSSEGKIVERKPQTKPKAKARSVASTRSRSRTMFADSDEDQERMDSSVGEYDYSEAQEEAMYDEDRKKRSSSRADWIEEESEEEEDSDLWDGGLSFPSDDEEYLENPKTMQYVYIGGGVLALGGLIWYLKNKSET